MNRFTLRFSAEAFFWATALVWLAVTAEADGFSFCVLRNLGFTYCPGCGIGHAIGWALRGQWSASVAAHPLGIPAAGILLHRIITLTFKRIRRGVYHPVVRS